MGGSDGQGIIEGVGRNNELKAPLERGGLNLRIAYRKTVCVGGHQAQHVIFDRHLHAGENLTVLIGRGDAPNTRYHFGQNVGRKFDRALKSKRGELREIDRIERVQPKGALGAGDGNLSIFHNKVNRCVGKRLCNTGEHLAGNNHATRLIHTGGNTMTSRDGVVACLEFKNTVFRFDENAGEDGKCRCTRNALLYDGESICERRLTDGEAHLYYLSSIYR